ncbi:MAG: MarR family transcriptional regulator [Methanobacterium sp.]
MSQITKDKLIEGMMEDTLIYIKLFNRELLHLGDRKFLKTFFWLILIEKYENPSLSAIGKKFRVSKSQITSRMDELVSEGLVDRVHDENDRRIIRVILTSKGKDFIENNGKYFNKHLKELLSSLSLTEVEELNKSIITIKNVVLRIQGAFNE